MFWAGFPFIDGSTAAVGADEVSAVTYSVNIRCWSGRSPGRRLYSLIRSLPPRPEMPEYIATNRRTEEPANAADLPLQAQCLNAEHLYLMTDDGWTHENV